MKSILVITQKVDQEDDLLGFFVAWLREFARSFDRVFVIALAKGKYDLPSNVVINSLGKEKNAPKFIQAFRFYKLLFQLVPQADSIFAHMSPIFAIAAWPITFIYGRKIVLWYLHRSVTPRLQFAEKLCASIVTADKDSLQLKSRKVVEVGHGIEVEKFRGEHDWNRTNPLRIISVGRISPIKNYETLIQAAYLLREKNFKYPIPKCRRSIKKQIWWSILLLPAASTKRIWKRWHRDALLLPQIRYLENILANMPANLFLNTIMLKIWLIKYLI